jgi:hypothetical protein
MRDQKDARPRMDALAVPTSNKFANHNHLPSKLRVDRELACVVVVGVGVRARKEPLADEVERVRAAAEAAISRAIAHLLRDREDR